MLIRAFRILEAFGPRHRALSLIELSRRADIPKRKNHEALKRQHLTVPILGISGSHGTIPDMAVSISPWADNTTGVVVPNAGHFIPDEQPEAVAAAIADFIGDGD
jgi:pimeloyl-ACP methyl ester carboxylesterase